ncbi:hypothetical protein UFOVP513_46 [uncultured Caudovirales phage]|uniref:Uncharacterized protein n=1 Tax=uncultured Caudovirales phage TaxID=2100421 RepID=A0A6J5MMV9_9CAUD|nr:hypothetical protein UFOVP513_46 [uncultured Caudovirales phage]
MTNALVSVDQIQLMANAVAKSGLFGMKTPEQAMALMLVAQAEGYSPALAARDYHIIQGRPALKADAMLARFQMAGGRVEWVTYTDTEVKATFSHAQGGSITLSWTFDQARKIGLTGKDNWKNYPRAMLRARVISEGIRTVYPGCVVGVYTPEEVQDFEPVRKPLERDMGTIEVVESDSVPVEESISTMTNDVPPEEWAFSLPGKDAVIYGSREEWLDALMVVVDKIIASKLAEDAKQEKIKALKLINVPVFKRFGLQRTTEIYKEIDTKFSASGEA